MRARDHREGSPAFEQWKIDRAAEIAQEQKQNEDAEAAAEAADPLRAFEKSSNQLAEQTRTAILTQRLDEKFLPGERILGRKINEDAAVSNFKAWAQQESTFRKYMFETLYAAMTRNDLAPLANNLGTMHRLLLQYNCYPDEPVQAAPVVIEPTAKTPTLTRSEQAIIDHRKYCEEIIGHDESGRGWTMQQVDALPSKEMLRLLRLFEKGHRGSSLLDTFREILDIKQKQDAERDKVAAQEMGGN